MASFNLDDLKTFLQKKHRTSRLTIAFAYVGALTGAGLASGQELMQYFLSFGFSGVMASIAVGILHFIFGGIMVSLGSHFLANDHNGVLNEIAPILVTKILDFGMILTGFVLGFVMIAGAGANLNQQFGLPVWIGALLCAVLVFVVSLFDFEKVSVVIGSFTPLIVGLIVVAVIHVFLFTPLDFVDSELVAQTMPTIVPNVILSLLNYFALCLMTGASIAFVLGGEEYHSKVARQGGLLGGGIVGIATVLEAFTLYAALPSIAEADMPMLTILTSIHPWVGLFMAFVIFGMIFNTAISLYYALARRIAGDHPNRFFPTMAALCLIGFGLSFFGFKKLLSIFYPVIGYIGFVLIATLALFWIRSRSKVNLEDKRRTVIVRKLLKKYLPNLEYKKSDREQLRKVIDASPVDNDELRQTASETVKEDLKEWVSSQNTAQPIVDSTSVPQGKMDS